MYLERKGESIRKKEREKGGRGEGNVTPAPDWVQQTFVLLSQPGGGGGGGHGCSMHGMPFHLQQWRPGPFPFTLYAVKLVGPAGNCFATPVLVGRDATAAIVVNEMRETAVGVQILTQTFFSENRQLTSPLHGLLHRFLASNQEVLTTGDEGGLLYKRHPHAASTCPTRMEENSKSVG